MKKRVTKTESLRLRIFRDILRGKYSPGDPLPPEREMALLAKVSRIIVRQAYAELEAAGIVQREQGRGTFVARTAGGSAHNKDTIALLTSIRDAFSLEFLAAVEQAVARADAMLVIKLTEEDPAREEAAAIELVAKGVRNLIVWPSGRGLAEETFRRLRVLGTNMVFFDRVLPGDYADYIGLDNARPSERYFSMPPGWGHVISCSSTFPARSPTPPGCGRRRLRPGASGTVWTTK